MSQIKIDKPSAAEPLAVVGMSCRFPGASSLKAFWELLTSDQEVGAAVSDDRFSADLFKDKLSEFKKPLSYRGYFLSRTDIDNFDSEFFKISPREMKNMDPQQRMILKVAWEALEDAGINPLGLNKSRTGVYVGASESEFRQIQTTRFEEIDGYTGTGGNASVIPGRLSFFLGLRGPSLSVDTACSSSLVATHLACQSLRSGETDLFIVGGSGFLAPALFMTFGKAGMLAPDGKCKTFDSSADGYARGEGCGVIVIKRLADAIANNDSIYGVIRGSGVNHGGHSKGLTVPNQEAQESLLREVLRSSGVDPKDISYVEAHGTGTPIGDPIEATAIGNVHGKGGDPARTTPLLVGSVKTHIGHLEAASGIAGIIKVLLGFEHGQIPRSRHFKNPNPAISFETLGLKVVSQDTAWPSANHPIIAGINSFGFGGTNSHLLVASPPVMPSIGTQHFSGPWVLPLSARSQKSLKDLILKYSLDRSLPKKEIQDILFSAATGRNHFRFRKAFVATSTADLTKQISESLSAEPIGSSAPEAQKITVSLAPDEIAIWPQVKSIFDSWNLVVEPTEHGSGSLTIYYQTGTPRTFQVQFKTILANPATASFILKELYEGGVQIDWSSVFAGKNLRKVRLPTYAFDESSFPVPRFRVSEKDTAPSSPDDSPVLQQIPSPIEPLQKQTTLTPPTTAPVNLTAAMTTSLSSWVSTILDRHQLQGTTSSRWFINPRKIERPAARLFCFPFAGGSAEIYRKWADALPSNIELHIAALPGRDHRSNEPHPTSISDMVEKLAAEVRQFNDNTPYFFYGHSMGGMIAFELANFLDSQNDQRPLSALLVGGSWPPHLYSSLFQKDGVRRKFSTLNDSDFLESLRQWGGIPSKEDLEIIDLKSHIIRLRADFVLMEEYAYTPNKRLKCPIYAFAGELDTQNVQKIADWGTLTESKFTVETFPNHGHFFVSSNWKVLSSKIGDLISGSLRGL